MSLRSLLPRSMKVLTRDARLLFLSRFIRLFAYGSLSVVLVFYLIGLGLRESQTGILLTLTLIGDTVISLYLKPARTGWGAGECSLSDPF